MKSVLKVDNSSFMTNFAYLYKDLVIYKDSTNDLDGLTALY